MFNKKLYVRDIRNNNVTISTVQTGLITGIVDKKWLKEYIPEPEISEDFNPYVVQVTANVLNVRAGAGTNYKIVSQVKRHDLYTIIAEYENWGKLKSGLGWISLDHVKKIGVK